MAGGDMMTGGIVQWRRALGWTVVMSLCVSAVAGSAAVAGAGSHQTSIRVLLTSLGFAIFSSTAAAGGALVRSSVRLSRVVGGLTVLLSAISFLLLLQIAWLDWDDGSRLRGFGTFALLALASSHASIVIRGMRRSDAPRIVTLCLASIVLGVVDCGMGALVVSGAIDIPYSDAEAWARAAGVVLIAMLLTTALPPILRRLDRRAPPPAVRAPHVEVAPSLLTVRSARLPWLPVVLVCALAIAPVAYMFGRSSTRARVVVTPATQAAPVPAPAPAPPPPVRQAAPRPVSPHVHRLAADIRPSRAFRCPDLGGGVGLETLYAGLGRVDLTRGPKGVCAVVATDVQSVRARVPEIDLNFHRGASAGDGYEIALRPSRPGRYALALQPPKGGAIPAKAGALGVSYGFVTILVTGPHLPAWVVDGTAGWTARVS